MNNVGIANVYKGKKRSIDGHGPYYEKIEPVFGFFYDFKDGKYFIVLTGELVGQTIKLSDDYDYICISDFMTLYQLCSENNGSYDYNKFIAKYQPHVGEYFVRNQNKNDFSLITDKKLIQKINGTDKDYDDKILDNNTDISLMYSAIKKTIISQDEQIMQILTSLFKNQRVVESSFSSDMIAKLKENIIVYGPTGTGKTEILKRIASIYEIPIVIEDATTLSETGYVGRDITDMLENLYLAAGKNLELAQKGILVIDEFDKLAEKGNNAHNHVSRIGVQRSLLKLLDGSIFYFGDKKFDTSRLSVVALGAFTDIARNDNYQDVSPTDFVNYGIMRELMGRFSKMVAMNPLSKEDIKKILVESDFSPLNTYKLLFESMNITFSYDEGFVEYIAEKAITLNSGARSLKTVFDNTINSAMFRIFAGEYSEINLTSPTSEGKTYVLTKKKK